MCKILVLTDSLGLPRDTPEEVLYEQTWPFKLKQEYNVLQSSIGGGTSRELLIQAAYLKMFKPNIAILQVGIVDCAPRILSFKENIILNHFWLTRKFLSFIVPRFGNKIRDFRKISYNSDKEFSKNLDSIIDFLSGTTIIALEILPASQSYEKILPNISHKIELFNGVLKEKFGGNLITLDDIEERFIMSDYHHLNADGHNYIFNKLKAFLIKGILT